MMLAHFRTGFRFGIASSRASTVYVRPVPDELEEPTDEPLAEPEDSVGDLTEGLEPDPAAEQRPHSLSDGQIEEVIRRLKAGRRLPPHLVPYLFETPREYGLAYAGN
jgi:hypothetical protein